MKFTVDTLPNIADLTDQTIVLVMESETQPDGTVESDPIITSATMSIADSGVTISFDAAAETVTIDGDYRDQYDQTIRWKRGQLERDGSGAPLLGVDGRYIEDPLQDPIDMQATGWGDVPPSPHEANFDINLLWYLYQFLPPADTSDKLVTYTVSGTMTTLAPVQDPPTIPPAPDPVPVPGVPFTATIDQTVFYDVAANEAQFKRYFPRGGAAPPPDFTPPGTRPNTSFPYILPLSLGVTRNA